MKYLLKIFQSLFLKQYISTINAKVQWTDRLLDGLSGIKGLNRLRFNGCSIINGLIQARKARVNLNFLPVGFSLLIAFTLLGSEVLSQSRAEEVSDSSVLPEAIAINNAYNSYILGPGDSLEVELLGLPELSGVFTIGPDGTLYLPRLRALYVEGLTLQELNHFLFEQFSVYVKNPEIYIRPIHYRPVRVYVSGEVKRPGYYTLAGQSAGQSPKADLAPNSPVSKFGSTGVQPSGYSRNMIVSQSTISEGYGYQTPLPTLFDAIRSAQGITPYSDLSSVQVTRKQPLSAGGGRMRAKLNFITLLTKGDETQNIRLFDGDVVNVPKSDVVMIDQLLQAGRTNISPQFLQVYVSGRVKNPGGVTLPQASSLNQAISLAGGLQVMHGKIEFTRFTQEGQIDRRVFSYSPNAPSDDYRNPILMAGDVVRVKESILSATSTVLNELTAPLVGIYSVYSIYQDYSNIR